MQLKTTMHYWLQELILTSPQHHEEVMQIAGGEDKKESKIKENKTL